MNQLFEWIARVFQGARPWVVVLAWERAVRVRLGRNVIVLDPGLHLRIPFVDEIRTINTRLRIAAFPPVTVSTKDGKVLVVAGTTVYTIVDPMKAFLAMSTPDLVLAAIAQSEVAQAIAMRELAALSPEIVENVASKRMRSFGETRGLSIESVRLVDYAVIRAYRLLQDQWRPGTNADASH